MVCSFLAKKSRSIRIQPDAQPSDLSSNAQARLRRSTLTRILSHMLGRVMERVPFELLLAPRRAEVISPSLVLALSKSSLLVHVHSTYGIGSHSI